MRLALIITTYNRPDALELVLLSVLRQGQLPDEILIADDGSTESTRRLIADFMPHFAIPLRHIWQPDEGFRLARSRNGAIAHTHSDYIVMIDGDMILHPHFVQAHRRRAQRGYWLQGSRVLLSEALTQKALQEKRIDFSFWEKGITNRFNMLDNSALSYMASKEVAHHEKVRGCHWSFWRNDVERINGFNEDFVGWGREDSEFALRLLNSGVRRINLKFAAVAYHLYHPESSAKQVRTANDLLLENALATRSTRCKNGLNTHHIEQ
ncbi:MAG: glycosyltransferase family 2 protein [Sphingobacteriales bacterium]|nr:glycosyltransferase family 2 protein [Sphingobacteriales bacterium]